jgi:predicted transcriptional regulator
MENKNLLKSKTRRDIYNHILRFPGIYLSELSSKLNLRKNNVDYHLKILKKYGLIESCLEDGYIRFYPVKLEGKKAEEVAKLFAKYFKYENKDRMLLLFKDYIPGHKEKKILNLLKRPVIQNILGFLYLNESSLMEISRGINKHWTTTSFHLRKLINVDVVEIISKGSEKRYKLRDFENLLLLSVKIHSWKEYKNNNGEIEYKINQDGIDKVIEGIFDVLPHPYHV